MEEIPTPAPAPSASAPTSRARGLRSSIRLGGVSRLRRGAGEPGPVRRVRVRFLLWVSFRARPRARGVSGDGFGVPRGGHRAAVR